MKTWEFLETSIMSYNYNVFNTISFAVTISELITTYVVDLDSLSFENHNPLFFKRNWNWNIVRMPGLRSLTCDDLVLDFYRWRRFLISGLSRNYFYFSGFLLFICSLVQNLSLFLNFAHKMQMSTVIDWSQSIILANSRVDWRGLS